MQGAATPERGDITPPQSSPNASVGEQASIPKKRKRRENRPGFNSYLKVILNDRTIDFLYDETQRLKANFENIQLQFASAVEALNDAQEFETSNQHDNSNDSKFTSNGKRKQKIVTRSRGSLHLTFFFGGETLCQLPEQELVEWHAQVQERLGRSGFVSSGSSSGILQDGLSFRIKEFRTFPPKRNYLIVAILEASAGWHELHDDIRNIAKKSTSEALQAVVKYSKDKWTPHITLANIQGGNRQERQILSELLANITTTSETIVARSISMGGPVPSQANLCWEFSNEEEPEEQIATIMESTG